VAALANLVFAESTMGWVVTPALVLAGSALFRRPHATTTIIFVAAWTIATWTNWGWETVYEETRACIFPGRFVLHTYGLYEDEVRCELPTLT